MIGLCVKATGKATGSKWDAALETIPSTTTATPAPGNSSAAAAALAAVSSGAPAAISVLALPYQLLQSLNVKPPLPRRLLALASPFWAFQSLNTTDSLTKTTVLNVSAPTPGRKTIVSYISPQGFGTQGPSSGDGGPSEAGASNTTMSSANKKGGVDNSPFLSDLGIEALEGGLPLPGPGHLMLSGSMVFLPEYEVGLLHYLTAMTYKLPYRPGSTTDQRGSSTSSTEQYLHKSVQALAQEVLGNEVASAAPGTAFSLYSHGPKAVRVAAWGPLLSEHVFLVRSCSAVQAWLQATGCGAICSVRAHTRPPGARLRQARLLLPSRMLSSLCASLVHCGPMGLSVHGSEQLVCSGTASHPCP